MTSSGVRISFPAPGARVIIERWKLAHTRGVTFPASSRCVSPKGWPSFPEDPERAHRVLTAPGVTAVVARERDTVVGYAHFQSDGEIQAHLSSIAVDRDHRLQGIARQLLAVALDRAGGGRIDLVTDSAENFYEALEHKRWSGFRIYPPFV